MNNVRAADSAEYAMMAIVKGTDSPKQYVKDRDWSLKSANLLMENNEIRHKLEKEYSMSLPL